MEIEIKKIYCCKHTEEDHTWKFVFSRAAKSNIRANTCDVRGCKCHNFQKTPFAPVSGKVEVAEKKIVDDHKNQSDFNFMKEG